LREAETSGEERIRTLLRDMPVEIREAGTMLVLRTLPGSAHALAAALDRARWREVVGSIAGDDTVFVAFTDRGALRRVRRRLEPWASCPSRAVAGSRAPGRALDLRQARPLGGPGGSPRPRSRSRGHRWPCAHRCPSAPRPPLVGRLAVGAAEIARVDSAPQVFRRRKRRVDRPAVEPGRERRSRRRTDTRAGVSTVSAAGART
jgi:hypothetical protein